MQNIIKQSLALCFVSVFLAGCGGDSSSDNESIQSDPTIEVSSLITTIENDTDENGIQDKVDKKLEERYTNPTEYKQAVYMAKSMQEIINSHLLGDGEIEQAVRNFAISAECHNQIFDENSTDELQTMQAIAFTSLDQFLIYAEMTDEHYKVFDENSGLSESECL